MFALDVATNIADSRQAAELADAAETQLAFFDWLEDPEAVAREGAPLPARAGRSPRRWSTAPTR